MLIDVIILTNSHSDFLVWMARRTIKTILESETDIEFNIIVVESVKNVEREYADICHHYIFPDERFNYNKFINIASQYCKGDWVIISNNDVSYEFGWLTEIFKVHKLRPDIESFSPKDPLLFMSCWGNQFIGTAELYTESYQVSKFLMGWSLVIKRESFNKILPFDEQFDMYYQDNDYAEVLKINGIKHALVRRSIASHYNTLTAKVLRDEVRPKMKEDELKFRNKWEIYT